MRLRNKAAEYWDYAASLELAVLEGNADLVRQELGRTLSATREVWQPLTTARNLALLRVARAARGEEVEWIDEIIRAFQQDTANPLP